MPLTVLALGVVGKNFNFSCLIDVIIFWFQARLSGNLSRGMHIQHGPAAVKETKRTLSEAPPW